ncbi:MULTISPECIES: hypothetical protein [Kaistia]|uniref:Uncharacterized protein n=1 Tax=Kaistia nematophila TaxID=2994654 RepID=A0A9X3E0Q2_9HYPH|nr:hypothetical protein [Kaistia nematophila]MCX5569576.1 hypothetical protein [Kaistia nematophila]
MDSVAWRRVILRTCVFAGLIAASILLWWAIARLMIALGPLPAPAALF